MTREEFNEKMTDELVAKIKEKYVAAGAVDALILTKLIEDIHHFRGDNKYIVFYDKKIGLDYESACGMFTGMNSKTRKRILSP